MAQESIVVSKDALSGSMGVNLQANSSVANYLNTNYPSKDMTLGKIYSAVDFSAEYLRRLSEGYELGLECSYLIFSQDRTADAGFNYGLSYGVLRPSAICYRAFRYDGYEFRLGLGAGFRFAFLKEKGPYSSIESNYKAPGAGFLIRGSGITTLGDGLFALIGGDLRADFYGKLTGPGGTLYDRANRQNVSLNSFGLSIRLGLYYQL